MMSQGMRGPEGFMFTKKQKALSETIAELSVITVEKVSKDLKNPSKRGPNNQRKPQDIKKASKKFPGKTKKSGQNQVCLVLPGTKKRFPGLWEPSKPPKLTKHLGKY